jgi:hypothetical protein
MFRRATATCSGVLPSEALRSGGRPASSSTRTTPSYSQPTARCMAAQPVGSRASGLAPRSSSARTMMDRPSRAASSSGVLPS